MYLKFQFEDHICEGNALLYSYCEFMFKKIQNSLQFRNLVLDKNMGKGKISTTWADEDKI